MNVEMDSRLKKARPERTSKIYRGFRVERGAQVQIVEGEDRRPLDATEFAKQKSPTGFEWAYSGSGPSALGHSILTDAIGAEFADKHWSRFTHAVISQLPQPEFELRESAVIDWSLEMEE